MGETYSVNGVYRDRPEPYVHNIKDKEMVGYFTTHQPGEWSRDDGNKNAYLKIYGEKALYALEHSGLVCENNDGTWVGGTFWETRPDRPVYGGPQPGDRVGNVEWPRGFNTVESLQRIEKDIAAIKNKLGI
jgi:hypothetical protein